MKISDAMNSGQPTEPAAAAPQAPAAAAEEVTEVAPQGIQGAEEPTPEEQEIYERIVTAGLKVLNDSEDKVIELLSNNADAPAQSIADTTWLVMSSLAEQLQGDVDLGILFAAGAEVLEQVAETAHGNQIFQVDQKVINESWRLIMERGETELGIDWGAEMAEDIQNMTPEMTQELKNQFEG